MSDKLIKDILTKYDEDFATNTWLVPGGKARAIMHKCIERMAARAGVTFGEPQIVDASPDNVVIIVSGVMEGQQPTWSFGEASPKNNKNAYPYSMAEKRAKDRVALKLLNLHGLLYSEEEADDFKEPAKAAPVAVAGEAPTHTPAYLYLTACKEIIRTHAGDYGSLVEWWNSEKRMREQYGLSQELVDALKADVMARKPKVAA